MPAPSPLRRPEDYNRGGFTLIELIVVLTVAGIALLLVMPGLFSRGDTLGSDARKLAALFRTLGENAAFTKKTYTCRVDLDRQQWTYDLDEGEKTERPSQGVRLDGSAAASSGLVREGSIELRFSPEGADETVRFYLERNGRWMTVTVYPFSGRVRVEEGRAFFDAPLSPGPGRPLASDTSG